ncbi:ImmA/IrrE family metallo-endopeptidase [Nocardioides sp. R-C-SC26]|uniref:ImmA/IrrE family metallo-endopeptidase n=1 Tax=Nocardioides sp. R-C-SC26 TaxID=2870414 RepID=UPI001E36D5EF|nr:ImmA/IrrE family metallo-endopeptidase [Nocardioides sp. R-C-SC26]
MPGGHDDPVNEQRFAELIDLCAEHHIAVEWADLGPIRHGQYLRRRRLIELNRNLTLRQLVAGLAHEFAHYAHDDGCSTARAERRAWEYAARLLITPDEYAAAEAAVGPSVNAIAVELDLTGVLVEAWRRWWRNTGRWDSATVCRDVG